jgi:hypothetical protein
VEALLDQRPDVVDANAPGRQVGWVEDRQSAHVPDHGPALDVEEHRVERAQLAHA